MRYLVALAHLLALAAGVHGGEFQIQPAVQFSITPAVSVSDPSASSCFVWRHLGGVGQAGTGTCIACEDGRSLVITNAHVVEGTIAPTTIVNAGREYAASVLAVARMGPGHQPDLALVLVEGELPVAPIADRNPAMGERVRVWGFGGRMGHSGPARKVGQFLGEVFGGHCNATVPTISGDSGSGWFNDLGELVGVHWGNDGRAWGVPLGSVRKFVRERAGERFPRLVERLGKPPEPKASPAGFSIQPAEPFAAPSAPACAGGSCPTYTPRRRLLRW